MSIDEIKEIFKKINATSYSLNAMEIHNSRFGGELKVFAELISQHSFFEKHRTFSANEIRRMQDVTFALTFIITIMSTYFTREDQLEKFLSTYNDEFDMKEEVNQEIQEIIDFVEKCNFEPNSRAWKRSDLFTLLVELDRAIVKNRLNLHPERVREKLEDFYSKVDSYANFSKNGIDGSESSDVREYYKAAIQGTNDRSSRIKRGEIIQRILSE